MNEHNLIPFDRRTKEEARENGAKGGKASGISRRRKRDMKAKMKMFLELPAADGADTDALTMLGVQPEDIDNEMLLLAALFLRGKDGDVRAVREIRNILGKDTASAELTLRKEELKLKKQQMQNTTPGEQEFPALWAALSAEDEEA